MKLEISTKHSTWNSAIRWNFSPLANYTLNFVDREKLCSNEITSTVSTTFLCFTFCEVTLSWFMSFGTRLKRTKLSFLSRYLNLNFKLFNVNFILRNSSYKYEKSFTFFKVHNLIDCFVRWNYQMKRFIFISTGF